MKLGTFIRITAATLLALLLASCGGGGGNGDTAGTSSPTGGTSNVFDAVSIKLLSPTSLEDASYGGSSPNGVQLAIGYSGDVQALANRTVYVIVEDPHDLYESKPSLYIDHYASVVHLSVGGNSEGVPEGRYTGTMKIYACLDPDCTTQLRNSPLSLPYDVEMKPGLKLSQEKLNLETAFGVELPPSEVTVSMPFGASDWMLVPSYASQLSVVRSGNKLVLTPSPFAQPGTYTLDVTVQAIAPHPKFPETNFYFSETLQVTYTVTAGNVSVVMSPRNASYDLAVNDSSQRSGRIVFAFQQPGGNLDFRGVRYDGNPASATGHPEVNQWLRLVWPIDAEYAVTPCGTVPGSPNCLPAGVYRASLLYRYTGTDGVDTDMEFPVSMTIAP